jgi:hypothetical protein
MKAESVVYIIKPIFRYTFSDEFNEVLYEFAKIHQYDDRHAFKDGWEEWSNRIDIHPLIQKEISILMEKGFEGDIIDKMYKSARYYFRKKPSTDNKKEKERKEYIGFSSKILQSMDQHIRAILKENRKMAPAKAYDDYCQTDHHKTIIMEEIQLLKQNQIEIKKEELVIKFKKTYKNRLFQICNK